MVKKVCSKENLIRILSKPLPKNDCIIRIIQLSYPHLYPFCSLGGRMKKAVSYAQSVLQRHWDRTIPVQPEQIIQSIRNNSTIPDLTVEKKPLEHHINGKITYDTQQQSYIISINENIPLYQQRFTLAHELGHYILAHGEKYDKDVVLYHHEQHLDADEIEANAFSAELLMPKAVLRHLIFDENINQIEILAKKLWVSEPMMMTRLQHLGMIS